MLWGSRTRTEAGMQHQGIQLSEKTKTQSRSCTAASRHLTPTDSPTAQSTPHQLHTNTNQTQTPWGFGLSSGKTSSSPGKGELNPRFAARSEGLVHKRNRHLQVVLCITHTGDYNKYPPCSSVPHFCEIEMFKKILLISWP